MEAFMRKSPTTARLQPKSPATPAAAAEKETKDEKVARGALSDGRQEEIKREPDGIMNLVTNWSNRSIVKQEVINKMKHSQKRLEFT